MPPNRPSLGIFQSNSPRRNLFDQNQLAESLAAPQAAREAGKVQVAQALANLPAQILAGIQQGKDNRLKEILAQAQLVKAQKEDPLFDFKKTLLAAQAANKEADSGLKKAKTENPEKFTQGQTGFVLDPRTAKPMIDPKTNQPITKKRGDVFAPPIPAEATLTGQAATESLNAIDAYFDGLKKAKGGSAIGSVNIPGINRELQALKTAVYTPFVFSQGGKSLTDSEQKLINAFFPSLADMDFSGTIPDSVIERKRTILRGILQGRLDAVNAGRPVNSLENDLKAGLKQLATPSGGKPKLNSEARFNQLIKQGVSEDNAYTILKSEGYTRGN